MSDLPTVSKESFERALRRADLTWEALEALAATGACQSPAQALKVINQAVANQWKSHPCPGCGATLAADLTVVYLRTLPKGGAA
jgi:hypothetical protein